MSYKIAIDADSTLNNLEYGLIELYNRTYSDKIDISMFIDYDWYACLPFEVAERLYELLLNKELWDSLLPVQDSQSAIKSLIDNGTEVYIATATNPVNYPWKVEWFKKYFPYINEKHIICIHNKALLDVDFVVDDCIEQLLSTKWAHRICLDKSWNRNIYDECHSIHRCTNWKEIVAEIKKIIKEEEEYV